MDRGNDFLDEKIDEIFVFVLINNLTDLDKIPSEVNIECTYVYGYCNDDGPRVPLRVTIGN